MIESNVLKSTQELIHKFGIHPSSLNGQNFLIDEDALETIINTAAIIPGEKVLEIGPGLGVLTQELLAAGAQVTAVEKDADLVKYLEKRFKENSNLKLINQDILKWSGIGSPYRLIANIPYSITAKIIRRFVAEDTNKPASILILVQKEVGERVCAIPGKLNLLAIGVQLYAKPSIVALVDKTCFYPQPKVDSCLLLIDKIGKQPVYPINDLSYFWRILHFGFSSPRKQLHNNLAVGLEIDNKKIKNVFESLKIKEKVRAQELSIEQWIKLVEKLQK